MGCGSSNESKRGSFIWGSSGSVLIKNIRFKAAYNSETAGIEVLYPKNLVTVSELSWTGRRFTLRDKMSIDFSTSLSYNLPDFAFVFKVNKNDAFVKVENLEDLVEKVSRDQNSKIDTEKREILYNKFTRECKDFWDLVRTHWLKADINESEVTQYNRPCVRVQSEKKHDRQLLEKFARRNPDIIELYDISRGFNARGFFEIEQLRPFTVSIQRHNFLHAGTNHGTIVQYERELRTMLFCWKDIEELNSFDTLKYEMNNIDRGIQAIMKEMKDKLGSLN